MKGRIASLVRRYGRPVLGVTLGAGAGGAYAYFVGCTTGGCAITSNPLLAAAVGALIGLSIAGSGEKPKG